jgi:4-hydroxy-tetrahydrodipicolinate synthase
MSGSAAQFGRVWVALPSFFDERGQLDDRSLAHVVDYLCARPVHGLALLTEAAEDAVLLPEERRRLIDQIAARCKGKREFLVHVSAVSTREAIDLSRHAEAKGASGLLLGVPSTPGLGYPELYRHLDRVGRATQLPCFLVIRPENAVDRLTPEEAATLGQHERLRGIFMPQGNAASLTSWAKRFKGRAADVFSGCALTFFGAARAGATGAICGLTTLAVEPSAQLVEAVKTGDLERVRELEARTEPAVSLLEPPRPLEDLDGVKRLATKLAQRPLHGSRLLPSVSFASIKEGLRLQGHPVKRIVRPPFEQLTPAESEKLRAVLKASGLIS